MAEANSGPSLAKDTEALPHGEKLGVTAAEPRPQSEDDRLRPSGGSRLGFTCRSGCRKFGYMTVNHRTWAVNDDGVSLSDEITSRWLSQRTP